MAEWEEKFPLVAQHLANSGKNILNCEIDYNSVLREYWPIFDHF